MHGLNFDLTRFLRDGKGKQKGMDQIGAGNFGSLSAEGSKQDNGTFQSVYLIKLQELMIVGCLELFLRQVPTPNPRQNFGRTNEVWEAYSKDRATREFAEAPGDALEAIDGQENEEDELPIPTHTMPIQTIPDMLGHSIQGLLLPQLPQGQVRREHGLLMP
ncbi:hypothetical protein Acr_08g0015400 [Actinidia rufa]|uniref:Uncharacterized protein n=1 Tax=Actinidia rufa TaxID=165716 RepID=A0A7J0F388_9ERIC|nr:hypothetical protein Acr_08g0015400 [Actinidia rufa]